MKDKYFLLFFTVLFPVFLYAQVNECRIPEDYLKNPGRPILVMFTANWCVPCQLMKVDIFPHPEIKPLLQRINFLMMDIDTKEGKEYQTAFERNKKGIPHFILMNKDQHFIAEYHGYNKDPKRFAAFLNIVLQP